MEATTELLKIIYLSRNISKIYSNQYVSSSYQQDVINELSNNCNLYNASPIYFNPNLKTPWTIIGSVLKKSKTLINLYSGKIISGYLSCMYFK